MGERTQRGLLAIFLFFLGVLMVLGFLGAAGWFGQSINQGLGYLFGWDRVLFPALLAVWGYHVLKPDLEIIQPRNVIGFVVFFLSLNPLVHLWTFERGAAAPDAALVDAGGKVGQLLAEPLATFIGSAGSVAFLLALLLASVMLIFHVGLEDVLFFLTYVKRAAVWLWELVSQPVRAWMDKRVMVSELPETFRASSLLAQEEMMDAALASPATINRFEAETEDEEEAVEEEDGEIEEIDDEEEIPEDEENEAEPKPKAPPKKRAKRTFPKVDIPFDLLELREQKPSIGNPKQNEDLIRRTLSAFGIPVESAGYAVGPTVTQYMVKPAEGIKVSRIVNLQNDLALALSAQSIRIEAPIPGKPYVGIEVPNQTVAMVTMREMLESKEYRERKNSLCFVLGKDVSGKTTLADLGKMPHGLVAGATGSGKSVCLNTMIVSLLYSNRPDELRFVMVDPKRVEMQMYNGIPHLLTPVITEMPEAVNALKWAVREMSRRYALLPTVNAKNITDYNTRAEEKLPYIVFVIDELADMMMTAKNEIEGPIVRLCQMARAVGIHLVLATQRPSVDVITGLIKANVPARIAFAVASSVDSKTILDQPGAERLLGRGDMLLSTSDMPAPRRVQGAFISDQEIVKVVDFIKSAYGPADFDLSVTERSEGNVALGGGSNDEESDQDPLLAEAWNEVLRAGRGSASLLQRRLKVGYSRAARILDEMEQLGWIGPENGAKGRELLRKTASQQMELPGTGVPDELPDEPITPGPNAQYYDL